MCIRDRHYANVPELLRKLVMDAPGAIQWLNQLGVEFDKAPDGTCLLYTSRCV